MIDEFKGQHRFLSNFFESSVIYEGILYRNSEAAYQAQKCIKDEYKLNFTKLNAKDSKILGSQVKLREDWDEVKDEIMYEIVLQKFRSTAMYSLLKSTGEQELVEGNSWGDTYWGVCKGEGKNKLGKILMRVRTELNQLAAEFGV